MRPNIKNYLNINDFLKDIYGYKKAQEVEFSYGSWAAELGVANKSFLRQIVMGHRSLTEVTAKAFCEDLKLSKGDREYFHLLVLYSKARTAEQRDLYGRRLRQLVRLDYEQQNIRDKDQFVLKTIYPRLQTLLSFDDVEKTPETLAGILQVPLDDVREGLDILASLDLVAPVDPSNSESVWQAKTKAFKVPENLGSQALLDYHQDVLLEAIQARYLTPEARRYRSLILALKDEEFDIFLSDLEIFVKQTLSKFDSDQFSERKLFQMNFNLHSVSEKALEPNQSAAGSPYPGKPIALHSRYETKTILP